MKLFLLPILIILFSCAKNSGIVPLGKDEYMVSRQAATGFSGMGTLKADALTEAYEHCKKIDKEFEVIKSIDATPPFVYGNFPKTEIYFKCRDETSNQNNNYVEDSERPNKNGSGFIISNSGSILTNQHVINGCSSIKIKSNNKIYRASLVAADPYNDLAILNAPNIPSVDFAKFRSSYKIEVGEEVTVVGYPFGEFLGSNIKATSGTINSVTGIGNDSSMLQIDAPIQPGNSGGPLLDSSGNVIGVITSKLDELGIANLIGSLPQNVNFAKKITSIVSFLSSHNIHFDYSTSKENLTRPQVVKKASQFTVMIECK